jgi:acyl-CoA dehydrogenase
VTDRDGDPHDGGQPTEQEFEAEVRAFYEAHAMRRPVDAGTLSTGTLSTGTLGTGTWGTGSDKVGLFPERTPEEEAAELAEAKAWAATAFDAGLGWITGPLAYGGRGLTRSPQQVHDRIASEYLRPPLGVFTIGLGMVAPTILAHATEEVRQATLRPLYRGDLVGCQLFSEPGAGSDLASVQARAVRDGDEWVVDGQKVWTSGAQLSDIGEVLCRTDPEAPKHRGLTAFVVDMHAPGVEVRPLRQMTGGASFNEVFFTGVRIPDSHRLGEVNDGWRVALTTLMNERAAIGGGSAGAGSSLTRRLLTMARAFGRADDPLVRQQLAAVVVNERVASYTNLRALASVAAGQAPGPELSVAKLALTANMVRTAETVASILGPKLVADGGEWGTYAWSEYVLGVPGMRIAGGTDEVLRNIIGERVLGLPKEPSA